jgi:hypothetical protein
MFFLLFLDGFQVHRAQQARLFLVLIHLYLKVKRMVALAVMRVRSLFLLLAQRELERLYELLELVKPKTL